MDQIEADPEPRRVFISHSSRDAPIAVPCVAALEAAGIPCWIAPRDVPPGSRYGAAIIAGINDCARFVLLLSEHSNASPQVLAEVERAVSKGLSVLTIRLETVALDSSLEYFLSSFHWIDAFSRPLDSQLPRLVEAVRQLGAANERARPAAVPTVPELPPPIVPKNLPQQATSFVGRSKEIADITALLPKTRLLTLTGSGGSGKTRLALHVADHQAMTDGVCLVELAPLADHALVPQAVADVLSIREEAGTPLVKTLGEALKTKQLLLILDNCEHVLSSCAALAAEFIRSCPGVRLLASSREPLSVPGEAVYRVPSLSLPDLNGPLTAEVLAKYEAVRLFVERAQAARPDFALTDANASTVAQICCRLDGIPLALELAAARVRSLSIDDVNLRLDNRFRLLTGGSKTLLPRQQTLRALIDWSYDLLTDQEKVLLTRLSVFTGGWDLAAAEGVCAGERMEDWEVLDVLTALVDKSLVVYAETGGVGRYRLLETVRQYAGERLDEDGETPSVRARHQDFFLALSEKAAPLLKGPDQGQWLSRLEAEHDNLREDLAWSESETGPAAADRWLRLCVALQLFWDARGHYSEGRLWLGRALERTEEMPPSSLRVRALVAAARLAMIQGDYDEAWGRLEKSLSLARSIGDQHGMTDTLNSLGNVAFFKGDYPAAQAAFQECLTIARQRGDRSNIANALGNLGMIAGELNDYDAAKALQEEGLTIRRQVGDLTGLTAPLGNLGNIALYQGDYRTAQTLFEEVLSICEQVGYRHGMGAVQLNLGLTAFAQGDPAAARARFEGSLSVGRQLNDRLMIVEALEGLAAVAASVGDAARGGRIWSAAEVVGEKIGSPLPPRERQWQERQMEKARALIGDDAFSAVLAAGRLLTLEQAIAEATE